MSEGRETFGKYELVRRIAQGGMAEIFLAAEHGFGGFERELVVKRIRREISANSDFVVMFTDEARLVSRLSHPNIASVYDFGEVDGMYYLTMEFVDGLTVAQFIRRLKAGIPLEIALRVVADICSCLQYAHELRDNSGKPLGVVHRDVSPQNVMISKSGLAKLIDFGVARAATQVHRTAVDQLKGKLAYMAPEMLVPTSKRVVDRRADIFALGVLLFEMVTGKRLFRRKSQAATILAVRDEDPPSVASYGLPRDVDAIIGRAVEKQAEKRYATAQEMQDAIEELIVELIGRGSRLVTPHVISRFVEENIGSGDMLDDGEESSSSDSDGGDTLPGAAPQFSYDNLPVMPGATPVPRPVEEERRHDDDQSPAPRVPPPPPMPPPPASRRVEPPKPPESSLTAFLNTLSRYLPVSQRWSNRQLIMLGAFLALVIVLGVTTGFLGASVALRSDQDPSQQRATTSGVDVSATSTQVGSEQGREATDGGTYGRGPSREERNQRR